MLKHLLTLVLLAGLLVGCGKPAPPAMSLHEAASQGNVEVIQQHIKAGSDLNEREPTGGGSPLMTATVFDQLEAARVLVEAGANVNSPNNDNSTPLHTAAFFCHAEIVELLLESGADRSARNNAGATAYESVAAPWNDVKGIYDYLQSALGPLGVQLDYARLRATRPDIAALLRSSP
jgi:ankyrin repeat protein